MTPLAWIFLSITVIVIAFTAPIIYNDWKKRQKHSQRQRSKELSVSAFEKPQNLRPYNLSHSLTYGSSLFLFPFCPVERGAYSSGTNPARRDVIGPSAVIHCHQAFGRHSIVIRPSAVIDCHSIVIGYWLLLTAEAQRTQRLIFFVFR